MNNPNNPNSTFLQLLRRYDRPCLPLDEVRAEYLPHISSEKNLIDLIHQGRVRLRYTRTDITQKALRVVYLRDLAAWLDALDPNNEQQPTATHQVA